MGIFGDIASSRTYEGGSNFFIPGEYDVVIKSAVIETSEASKKVKHAKVNCKIEAFQPSHTSREGQYKPGDEVKMIVEVTKDMGASNAKAFALAVGEEALWKKGAPASVVKSFRDDFREHAGVEPHPCEKHLEDIFKVKSIAEGTKIHVHAYNKPTGEGKDFTRLKWVVLSRPEDFDPRA